jgi:hypothetical protein
MRQKKQPSQQTKQPTEHMEQQQPMHKQPSQQGAPGTGGGNNEESKIEVEGHDGSNGGNSELFGLRRRATPSNSDSPR